MSMRPHPSVTSTSRVVLNSGLTAPSAQFLVDIHQPLDRVLFEPGASVAGPGCVYPYVGGLHLALNTQITASCVILDNSGYFVLDPGSSLSVSGYMTLYSGYLNGPGTVAILPTATLLIAYGQVYGGATIVNEVRAAAWACSS